MGIIKTLLIISIFGSVGYAKNYFVSGGDICENASDHYCSNNKETIKNLQISLGADKRVKRLMKKLLKAQIKYKKERLEKLQVESDSNLWLSYMELPSTKLPKRKPSQNKKTEKTKEIKIDIKADGILGKNTINAIKAFQKLYKLKPADGWVGKSTKEKLDKVYNISGYSFLLEGDMCEEVEGQECPNDYESVRNLQITLNNDPNLTVEVVPDGIWGTKTMNAVSALQKRYGMVQVDGWVGKGTKRRLDIIAKGILFPAVDKRYKKLKKTTSSVKHGSYGAFKKSSRYPRTFSVYKNKKLLAKAKKSNTKIVVDISEQRIKLFVADMVAIDSPCTTGAARKLEPNTRRVYNKSTPKGQFKITEKIADKRSNIFGKLYRNGKMVWRGDRRKYRGKKAKYIGASLKNWMRLTSSGIGIHGSKYIKRYPATNGCIRVPYNVVDKIFKYAREGTPVKIVK